MKTSRRTFITGASALAATALSQPARAQSVIDEILASTQRGSWDDQFDARATAQPGKVVSTSPIFSPETVAHIEQTLYKYQDIVARSDRSPECISRWRRTSTSRSTTPSCSFLVAGTIGQPPRATMS